MNFEQEINNIKARLNASRTAPNLTIVNAVQDNDYIYVFSEELQKVVSILKKNIPFNELKGVFDASENIPDLKDDTGKLNEEYLVVNAGSAGINKIFSEDNEILVKNDDVLIYNDSKWKKKVDNNQSQPTLLAIPPSETSPVSSSVLNNRMTKIFNLSGYRLTNIGVEGISNISNISTSTFCFFANGLERYLLVDFSNLDEQTSALLSVSNRVFNISTARSTNSATNDVIGEIKNQGVFNTNRVSSIQGVNVPSNYTIFRITQSFSTFLSGLESMFVSLDLTGDLNGIVSKTIVFEDEDFTSNQLIDLVPAPGDNKMILPLSFSGSINLTQGYEATQLFNLKLGDFVSGQILLPTTITNPFFDEDTLNELQGDDGTDSNSNDIINKPLQAEALVAMSAGLGFIKLHITYRIIEL